MMAARASLGDGIDVVLPRELQDLILRHVVHGVGYDEVSPRVLAEVGRLARVCRLWMGLVSAWPAWEARCVPVDDEGG